MTRRKTNGWAVVGAISALGYLAWKEAREAKKRKMNQESFQYQNTQNSQTLKKEPVNEVEIKKLYHELALRYHPDSAQSERDKEFRAGLFKKIKDAYDSRDIKTLRLYKLD